MSLVKDGKARARSVEDILRDIQEKVPYELNNQKPMRDLFKETPDENWLWEMEMGSQQRITKIWGPLKDLLVHLRGQLLNLKENH